MTINLYYMVMIIIENPTWFIALGIQPCIQMAYYHTSHLAALLRGDTVIDVSHTRYHARLSLSKKELS